MKTFAFLLLALAIPTASAATTEVSWGFDVTGASVQIDVGDTVKWVFDQDTEKHDVVSGSIASRPTGDSLFKSELLGKDSDFSHTFNEIGVFPYFCTPHNTMNAKITVVAKSGKNVVELAQSDAYLTTLVAALGLNGATLVGTLSGDGPFTVFAPTDDAFSNLDSTVLNSLLEPANKDALTNVLTYHVASGKVLSSSLSNGQKIMTEQGGEVEVTIAGSVVKINDATVTTPDLLASNGVVHIIDAVLMPIVAVSGSSAAAEPESSTAAAEPESSTAAAEPESSTGAVVDAGAAFNVSPTTKIAVITLLAAAVQFFGPQ